MPIDHDYIRVAADGAGKKVANVKQTDPDADEVYLQKTVTWSPSDESDAGGMEVVDNRGQVDAEVTGTVTANAGTDLNTSSLLTEAEFETRVGEVQATPTANTILGRLKAIYDAITGTLTVATHAVTQSGTWTVQPGNTANTTAWKVDGSAVTQPVSDAGGSLTVDGTVAATQSGTWSARITDGTDTADVLDLTNSNPLTVAIVDGSGDQVTSFGGGTQYTEGDTDASITGTAMLIEGAANTLVAAPGTAADGLLVNLGANNDITATNLDIRDLTSASDSVAQKPLVFESTGTLDAVSETVELELDGGRSAAFAVTGDLVGSLRFEGKVSTGNDWGLVVVFSENSGTYVHTITDDDTNWNQGHYLSVAGYEAVRVRCLARTSGSATILLRTMADPGTYSVRAIEDIPTTSALASQIDGHSATIGMTTDSEAPTADGTVIGLLKRLRTLLNGGLPAALAAGGGLKVEGVAGGVAQPVSDGSSSLTVDAPVATPVFVRLSDGASAISTLPVSLASVPSHAVTNAGTFAVQVDGSALTALQLIDDPVVQDDAGFTPGTTKVMMAGFEADESSTDSVDEGDGGAARMTLDRKQIVTVQPHTAGGLSTFMASGSDGSSILVATKQTIKASAGQLYGWYMYNPETAVTFVHVYNTDTVTVGTTNPQLSIAIPPLSATNVNYPQGIAFSTAMSTSATTTAGGNTAPATGVSAVFFYA